MARYFIPISTLSMLLILSFAALFTNGCRNNTTQPSQNQISCSNRISIANDSLIPDSQMVIVQDLFQKNGLSLGNLQVYRVKLDFMGYHHIKCNQYYAVFRLFSEEVIFHFNSQGIYSGLTNELITNVDIDTIPKISADCAGILFYNSIKEDSWYQGGDSLRNSLLDTCFNAELGIWDLNAGIGYTEHNFVLAWKFTTYNNVKYPFAYVRADKLSLIYYDNGGRF